MGEPGKEPHQEGAPVPAAAVPAPLSSMFIMAEGHAGTSPLCSLPVRAYRGCKGLVVLWHKMGGNKEMEVVIVNQNLGY